MVSLYEALADVAIANCKIQITRLADRAMVLFRRLCCRAVAFNFLVQNVLSLFGYSRVVGHVEVCDLRVGIGIGIQTTSKCQGSIAADQQL